MKMISALLGLTVLYGINFGTAYAQEAIEYGCDSDTCIGLAKNFAPENDEGLKFALGAVDLSPLECDLIDSSWLMIEFTHPEYLDYLGMLSESAGFNFWVSVEIDREKDGCIVQSIATEFSDPELKTFLLAYQAAPIMACEDHKCVGLLEEYNPDIQTEEGVKFGLRKSDFSELDCELYKEDTIMLLYENSDVNNSLTTLEYNSHPRNLDYIEVEMVEGEEMCTAKKIRAYVD